MTSIKRGFLLFSLLFSLSFGLLSPALAAPDPGSGTGETSSSSPSTGGSDHLEEGQVVPINNPLGNTTFGNIDSPQKLIGAGINALLGILGSIALLMFIYGGLLWLTSGGNDQQIKKGRDVVLYAAIGLIVVFASYAIIRFVITGIGG